MALPESAPAASLDPEAFANPAAAPVSASTSSLENWQQLVAPYRHGDAKKSLYQLATTWLAFFVLWTAAYQALEVSVALTLGIDLVLGLVIVRLFIFQHDCGHGSYFRQEWANFLAGSMIGVLMMTPYEAWRKDHAIHHATTGDLDRRGTGDIMTWTLQEYRDAGPFKRFGYRLFRNPFVMLIGGVLGVFLFAYRVPMAFPFKMTRREKLGVHFTTLLGVGVGAMIVLVFGWKVFLLVHLPAAFIGASTGIFLFYVQHQFEGVYWRRHDSWSYLDACIQGSSYLKLNRVLRWLTGDIGVHHIHHLAPKIPNYRLQACYDENPALQQVKVLSLWEAVSALRFKLYDEERGQLLKSL